MTMHCLLVTHTGDDLLPSETDNKGPPLIRPGALSRGDDSESNASITPSPSPLPPKAVDQSHISKVGESPVQTQKSEDQTDGRRGGPSRDSKQMQGDDDDEWNSEDEDLEEESEWERERAGKRDGLGEKLDNSGHSEELNRQQQWEEEERQKQEKERQEAEEELRREKEEQERERRQQEAERKQFEKDKAAEKRRQEEQAAEDRRRREEEAEVARKKAEIEAERQQLEEIRRQEEDRIQAEREQLEEEKRREQERRGAEDRRRREEEEAGVARKKAEIEAERQQLEEIRRQEEDRIQAERERLEEEKRREQEKRDSEQRLLEEKRKREEERLETERRKLEEEKQQTAMQRDEEHRNREDAIREEERRIEAERKRLEEQKQQEEERLEEAKRQENLDREKELQNQETERRRLEEDRRRIEEEKKQLEQERKLGEERKKMEDERRKREEERLEAERRRHEEIRQQFEEDQLRMTLELKDEDEIRKAMERKHLEDERQRLEEQRLEAEKRERQMEEQRMEEKRQLLSTQKEMEEMKRTMEQERAQFEKQLRDTAARQADEAVKKDFEETMKQEQERIKAEKERLEAENREIEKKRLEIEAMQKEVANKTQERQLEKYKESIEKRLADEDRSVNGMDDDNESLDEISRDLEAAVLQRQQIESGTFNANPGHTPGGRANTSSGVQSLANTGDFSAASLSPGNPISPMKGGAPVPRQSPAAAVSTNARSPTKALYNSPMLRSSTGPTNAMPTWHSILTEPDGLDYTSSEGEEEMMATQEGLHSSMLSPHQGASNLANTLRGSPGSPLPPSTNDPTAVIRLQSMVREQKRATERERNERLNANNQCKILQGEKAELQRRLDEVTKFKMSLDQQSLDLEAKIRGFEHELSQELERRHNSEVLLQKTKEQLRRKEELYAAEIEAKQKTELGSRNIQMELRSSRNVIKQLEEERNELRRQLNQEKAARAIQEEMVNDQRRAQEVLQESEAVNRLEAADESRKAAVNQSDKLKTELHALKLELEKQKMRHRDDQGLLVSENEELTGKIEELKSEMRIAEEALAHATMTYNAQLTAVRTENAMLHNGMEKEKHSKDQLKAEFDSVHKRLDATSKDLEKAEKARSELEHALQSGSDEWSRARERLEYENTTMKESSQTAAQRLGAAESRVTSLENELQAANTSLMERSNQLAAIQRDLDMKSTVQNSNDSFRQREREENVKLSARVETLTERLTEAQTEIGSLKRALDAAQHNTVSKDKDAQNAQDKFNNTLTSLQAENDRTRTIWEERNNSLQESISRLKEELQRSEHNSSMKDQDMRKLQQELTDSLLKVSITENHLEMAKKAHADLEKDKRSNRDQVKRLTDKVLSVEKERRALESRVEELQNRLVHADRSNLDTSHQLMATQTTLQQKSDLDDKIRQLEKENGRIEIGLKHETERSRDLVRKLEESQKMCNGLETMVTNIKTSQLFMEDKLSEATAARSLFAREVDDHKQLWETEVKSRSKLGLRIAQLERAKAEVQAQVDEEKKKTRKMAELKRSAEDKWQNEVQKVQQLEQEVTTLKAKIKLAKKKLKDQGPPELRLSTMQTEFERERLNMEAAMGTLRRQLEDVNQQLDRESMQRLNMEKSNRQLQQELTSSKTSEKTKDKLEKSKRRLEDELSHMKSAMENSYIEKGLLEKYKQDLDTKARMEINEKLEQVNTYLEEQSQAREKLEQLRISNEAEVRKELEDTIDDLKHQLSRLRNGYHDAQTRKDTMEAETSKLKEMYNQEVQRREKLSADLEKIQDKLLEAQAKLNFERQRNHQIREGSFNRDIGASRSPAKSTDPPPVDSIAEKVWSELDRSISRHLKAGPTDTGANLSDFHSDRLSNGYGATSPRGPDNSYMATLRKNYFV
ncbi:uncharacterized protein [Amphiura filiformis]|uniref:uncharacterized protein isoform X2 n=1 Tax=Amphiura filiformis TaxID=82378 RepID=UPI003B2280AC